MRPQFARLVPRLPALTGWLRAWSRRRPASAPAALRDLEWDEFQRLVVEGFLRRGYHATGPFRSLTPGSDLLLRHQRETYLVHCKSWRHAKVDVDAVQALQRAVLARGVNGGILVTTGRIGRHAARAGAAARIQMIDGQALEALVDAARQRLASAGDPGDADDMHADTVPTPDVQHRTIPTSPSCPLCGRPMRLRTARRGRHAGHGFWGCIEHPHCKGLRALTGYSSAAN